MTSKATLAIVGASLAGAKAAEAARGGGHQFGRVYRLKREDVERFLGGFGGDSGSGDHGLAVV